MEYVIFEGDRRLSVPPLQQIVALDGRLKVVDVGANPIDGAVVYAPLLATGLCDIVGFEPNLDALNELHRRKGPHETYLPHAIGDGERATLRICRMPGMTSLLEPNFEVLRLFHGFELWGEVLRREEIATVRLDDVPETAGIDMLKLDIQGAELLALQNAQERLKQTLVIHTEVCFLPMYVGQPLFTDIDLFLRGQGFVLHRFEPLFTRDFKPLMFGTHAISGHSQTLWADAVYMRDVTRLETWTPQALLRTAFILHNVYRSYDVSLLLLREHDRRIGTDLADRLYDLLRSSSRGVHAA
jgi:FkbM family methyltransferase